MRTPSPSALRLVAPARCVAPLRLLAASLALAAPLSGCAAEAGPPVEASALCAEIARVVCEADARCFDRATSADGSRTRAACLESQRAACEPTVGALAEDVRLGYDAARAGCPRPCAPARSWPTSRVAGNSSNTAS